MPQPSLLIQEQKANKRRCDRIFVALVYRRYRLNHATILVSRSRRLFATS
jgi:hypothetical protein